MTSIPLTEIGITNVDGFIADDFLGGECLCSGSMTSSSQVTSCSKMSALRSCNRLLCSLFEDANESLLFDCHLD